MSLLYTKMKVFHHTDKLESLSNKTITSPIHIRIKPTNLCNHKCFYCAYKADKLQVGTDFISKDYIPEKKMMEIINNASKMGIKAITFTGGGEPLMYPFILKTLKKLSQTPIKFSLLTNGSLLSGERAELLSKYATWIRISIDGWDDISYSEYRKVPHGEFTKLITNIHRFKSLNGKCLLGVSIIVDKTNYTHIYELIETLKTCGVDDIKISPCIVSDNTIENNAYHKYIFDEVKSQISQSIKDFADGKFRIFDSYHIQLETFDKTHTWCPYMQVLHVIGADQNVYTCQDKAYNLKEGLLGSIKDISYKDFWFSNKDKFYKINPSVHCNHHCVANEKNKLLLEYLEADQTHIGFV